MRYGPPGNAPSTVTHGLIQRRDMDLPDYRLHPLTGDRHGQWSVRVSGNWRIVFGSGTARDSEAADVTLIDYH